MTGRRWGNARAIEVHDAAPEPRKMIRLWADHVGVQMGRDDWLVTQMRTLAGMAAKGPQAGHAHLARRRVLVMRDASHTTWSKCLRSVAAVSYQLSTRAAQRFAEQCRQPRIPTVSALAES